MDFIALLSNKPVLVGLHLAFAIIGIDAFLWLLGEIVANAKSFARRRAAALIGIGGFLLSWIAGGYYYVAYYGALVKPEIKAGLVPWVHSIVMETKEHLFLFLLPLAFTVFFLTLLNRETFENLKLKPLSLLLVFLIVSIGLAIGLMGFMISAAARWAS